jgi:hypothetical protein
MFLKMAILGMGFSALCCSGSGNAPAEATTSAEQATCQDLSAQAVTTVLDAATSVPQCTIDSDCEAVPIPADCLSSCISLMGNDSVRNAVAAKADELASLCKQFHQKGCVVSEGGCPAHSNLYVCQMSQCTPQ